LPEKETVAATDEFNAPAEVATLNFDLDMPSAKPEVKPEADNILDFDLGDFSAKKDEPATEDISVKEVSASDFDQMLEFKPAPANEAVDQLEADLAAADLELKAIEKVEPFPVVNEVPVHVPQPEAAKAAAPLDFNFGEISLDLPAAASAASEVKPRPATGDNSIEMDTKIELAAAYLGIGDKEGARELLDEVIQEGSAEQVERAKEAMAKIS